MTHFGSEIRQRIASARAALEAAHQADDEYGVEVTLGELESLARVAADHDIVVEGVEDALASHGLPTPAIGVPKVIDVRDPLRVAAAGA
jgi:hypothetical protein